jgi:hypothetical protein
MRSIYVAAALLVTLMMPVAASADRLPGSDQGGAPLSAVLTPLPGMNGTGTASFTINPGQQELCYQITTTGVTLPVTAAHIHVLGSGAIEVPLFGPPTLPPPTNTMASSFGGCVSVSQDVALAILENPSNYYVNVHTPNMSGGLATIMTGTLTAP